MRATRTLTSLALAAALVGGGAAVAHADDVPPPSPAGVQHGPDPDATSITRNGPYSYATKRIARTARFGGGTIYYPTNASGERFSGVVTMPGFMEPGSVMNVYGTRLASHGFVVLVAEPMTWMDQPASRARQFAAAVEALRAQAPADVLDPQRVGIVGHSMGGGGALEAAETLDLQAVVAVHPWDQQVQGMTAVTEPTLVIGGGIDNIAPVAQHAGPMYRTISSGDKAFLFGLAGTHFAGLMDDANYQGRVLSFLKRTLDGDQRYTPLYCAPGTAAVTFQATACGR